MITLRVLFFGPLILLKNSGNKTACDASLNFFLFFKSNTKKQFLVASSFGPHSGISRILFNGFSGIDTELNGSCNIPFNKKRKL